MLVRIALVGNPNSGKTTLFNALTGANQFVGNWPGVTVEKKEGRLKNNKDVMVVDLPGIYSLSPYTLEEVVSRNFLLDERPDVILNIVDGTNLERNLFLTTQLTELGIPVVIAVNRMDAVQKKGDTINRENLAKALGCEVVEISALKGTGIDEAAETAVRAAGGRVNVPQHSFSGGVEHTLAHIEEAVLHNLPQESQRFFAIKLFERDGKMIEKLGLSPEQVAHIEEDIRRGEAELDDDSESIITTERYHYIDSIIKDCRKIKQPNQLSVSGRIDRVLTGRILALPIFAAVMVVVYTVSVTTVGAWANAWAAEGLFGEGWYLFGENFGGIWIPGLPVVADDWLNAVHCAEWLRSLVVDGMIAGVGAVLGFVPQIFVLFIFLAFLESCGYMARIAFILDRIFRKFGLSGKSFIPILIGTGCGVPGIMASRTIESDRDRKMTIITTTFIPCAAKLPIIALIAGALFEGAWWVAPSAYFVGIAAILCSGVMLKKTRLFAGDASPFVMEMPEYHLPAVTAVLRNMWERGWSFVKKAGTVILLSTIVLWFASNFGVTEGVFGMTDMNDSLLAVFGGVTARLFAPLGWGDWRSAVAAFTGLIAKENIVGTFGVLFSAGEDAEIGSRIAGHFTALSGYAFLLFNLLCAPCFAAIGAIRREMNNPKWLWFAIGYQCIFAYVAALWVYQFGTLFTTGAFGFGTAIAAALAGGFIYMLARRR